MLIPRNYSYNIPAIAKLMSLSDDEVRVVSHSEDPELDSPQPISVKYGQKFIAAALGELLRVCEHCGNVIGIPALRASMTERVDRYHLTRTPAGLSQWLRTTNTGMRSAANRSATGSTDVNCRAPSR